MAASTRLTEEAIVHACASANALWEDPHFSPSVDESWRRPPHNAKLFATADGVPAAGASIIAGDTGDGWLLGALCTLASTPARLEHLFVSVRGRRHGVYTLQLYMGETWVPLTIDDRLPCDEHGQPLYSRDAESDALWVPLVEKAFAKLLGSYAALRLGYLPHALRALTGGIPLELRVQRPTLPHAAPHVPRATGAAVDSALSPVIGQPRSIDPKEWRWRALRADDSH